MYYGYFARHLRNIKRGQRGNYSALCPFHDDKVNSFSFHEATGLWQCFACGEKGNIYQFLEKVGDREALEEIRGNLHIGGKREREEEEIEYTREQVEELEKIFKQMKDGEIGFKEGVNKARLLGFYVFPSRSKVPVGRWGTREEKDRLNSQPIEASGLLCLTRKLCVIDIDDLKVFCDEFGYSKEEIEKIATVRTGKGYHIYVYDEEDKLKDKNLSDGFEIRKGNKKLIMFPYSKIIHPTLNKEVEYEILNPRIYSVEELKVKGFELNQRGFYFDESLNFNPKIVIFVKGKENALKLIEGIPEHVDDVVVIGYKDNAVLTDEMREGLKGKTVYFFFTNQIEKKSSTLLEEVKTVGVSSIYSVVLNIDEFLRENSVLDAFSIAEIVYEANFEYIDIAKLLAEGVKEREFLDEEWRIPKGVVGVVAGLGGVGKGYLTVLKAIEWIQMGHNVCFLLGEDDREEVKRRILKLIGKMKYRGQKGKLMLYELLPSETIDIVEKFIDEYDVIIIDPLAFFVDDEINASNVAKTMRRIQYFCKTKNKNIFLVHHLKKFANVNSKEEMLDAIRGSGAFHNNARYVMFVKSDLQNKGIVVYNAKNSYAPRDADFRIKNIFNDEMIVIERTVETDEKKSKEKAKKKDEIDF